MKTEMKRTIAVFVGGVLLSFLLPIPMGHYLTPNTGPLIVRMFSTPPNSPDWDELWRQWHRINLLSLYVISPLVGLAVGIFVGLLQKQHPVLLAVLCQLPEYLDRLRTDHVTRRLGSLSGTFTYLLIRLLPFLAAALGAFICERLVRRKRNVVVNTSDAVT